MGTIAALNFRHKECCSGVSDDESMHLGKRLKKLMQDKAISTEAMAAHCGVTPGAVSNWFSSGHIARDNVVAVADRLGESVRYLLTGDERDREFSEIEGEFAKRDVAEGTRQAILTLLRASPIRAPITSPEDDEAAEDAEHFRRSLQEPTRVGGAGTSDRNKKNNS